jgi:hypothetical protein
MPGATIRAWVIGELTGVRSRVADPAFFPRQRSGGAPVEIDRIEIETIPAGSGRPL